MVGHINDAGPTRSMHACHPTDSLDHLPALLRDLGRRLGGLSLALGALTCALHVGQPNLPVTSAVSERSVHPLHRVAPPVDTLVALARDASDLERTVGRLERVSTPAGRATSTPADVPVASTSPIRFTSRLSSAALGGFEDVTLQSADTPAIDAASAGPSVPSLDVPRPEAPAAAGDRFVVMLDPGHGGTDPGAVAHNGLLEKDLTRDIAERVRLFLSEVDDIEVRMTREGDTGLSRRQRVKRVRDSGADLLLSLHFNHLPQTDITLVESYYAAAENIAESRAIRRQANGGSLQGTAMPDFRFVEGSARLAGLVQQRVYDEVSHENADAHDAGVKRETLFVLTRSETAGTLVELTCLSNPAEADRLASEPYRDRLAAALADAIRDYRRSLADRPLGALDV